MGQATKSTKEVENKNTGLEKVSKEKLDMMMPDDLNEDDFLNAVFDTLEGTDAKELVEVTSNYLDMKTWDDEEAKIGKGFIFTGMTVLTIDGKDIPAVKLLDRNRKAWVFGGAVVVSALKKVDKIPVPVKITRGNMVKTANGSYYDCRVFVL